MTLGVSFSAISRSNNAIWPRMSPMSAIVANSGWRSREDLARATSRGAASDIQPPVLSDARRAVTSRPQAG
jgi:hypothetical protein